MQQPGGECRNVQFHDQVLLAFITLLSRFMLQGKCEEADVLNRRAIEIQEKVLGADHPSLATSLNARMWLLNTQVRTNTYTARGTQWVFDHTSTVRCCCRPTLDLPAISQDCRFVDPCFVLLSC